MFYQKYYSDSNERIALFGINPGRFGGGITGVPFTDPLQLERVCGIANPFKKKEELSSRFIYEMIESYGGPEIFYSKFFISAISPLGFVRNGKNLNYYDIENWKKLFGGYAVQKINEQLAFPLNKSIALSIGRGKNLQYLQSINKEHQLFGEIKTAPHPRWVMQYRLKRKQEFIQQYMETLNNCQ